MFQDLTNSLIFDTVKNDGSKESSVKLIKFKTIISKALPNMDRDHIIRLLFDNRHESLLAYEKGQMIGGICYANFEGEKFVEIAFLAVKAEKRIQGYGKKIINKLKSILQKRKIAYMITYGDNMALGFFRKQGFSQKITMPKETWQGYIKQYDGGKLIQCKIHQNVDYINIDDIIKKQKRFVLQTIKRTSLNEVTFRGSDVKHNNQAFQRRKMQNKIETFLRDPRTIPGIIQSGWSWQQHDLINQSQIEPFNLRCKKLLQSIKKHPQSKYFAQPVPQKEVPTYKSVIKNPMDFKTMLQKLQKHQYKNQEHFCQDIELIFKNCRQFNHQFSVYCKSADRLKDLIKPEVQAFKNAVISTTIQKKSNKIKEKVGKK